MENPLVVDAKGAVWTSIPPRAVPMVGDRTGRWDADDRKAALDIMDAYGYVSTDVIAELALRFGFDGAIIKNVVDPSGDDEDYTVPSTVYVVFSPKQIKSATGNAGTFDPDDPNIYRNPRTRTRTRSRR
jgi:hypothetical protein